MAICFLLFLLVGADEMAAPTLSGMVARIGAGEFENNFFDGDVLRTAAHDDREAVGGCILDKVVAIVEEARSCRSRKPDVRMV